MREVTRQRVAEMRRLAGEGRTRAEVAEALGIDYCAVQRLAALHGVPFRNANKGQSRPRSNTLKRASDMAALFREGRTLQEIGDQYGVTRERVRQLIKKHEGLTGADGGVRLLARRAAARRKAQKDAAYLRRYGCTFAQWQKMVRLCRELVAGGMARSRTPLGAFQAQRRNAADRGIGWHLTFWQWWTIWQQSGKWEKRGRCVGEYVMCRVDDTGPYAVGNVFISTSSENIQAIYADDRSHEARLAQAVAVGLAPHDSRPRFPSVAA